MVANDNMMVTCAIDAHEERDVATIDLPQAFLNTNYEGPEVIMVLRGHLTEMMVQETQNDTNHSSSTH